LRRREELIRMGTRPPLVGRASRLLLSATPPITAESVVSVIDGPQEEEVDEDKRANGRQLARERGMVPVAAICSRSRFRAACCWARVDSLLPFSAFMLARRSTSRIVPSLVWTSSL
jgi:hypothetical protein